MATGQIACGVAQQHGAGLAAADTPGLCAGLHLPRFYSLFPVLNLSLKLRSPRCPAHRPGMAISNGPGGEGLTDTNLL